MPVLVFVPVSGAEAVALRSGADLGVRPGCAATPSLQAAAGADATLDEVEYAALSYAGDLARAAEPDAPRLVLAVDSESGLVTDLDTELGEVSVTGLSWSQVRSLFAEEPGESDEDADLLWYSTDELEEVAARSRVPPTPGEDRAD